MQWRLTIAENDGGSRIDMVMSLRGPFSRNAAQRLLTSDKVTLNGEIARKNGRVKPGDTVRAELPELAAPAARPEPVELNIVYEDEDLLVVDKPAGLVVHPAPGHESGTLVNALLHHCGGSLSGIGGVARPGIVHRLDKDTSGLIVAAKNDFAHERLSAALRRREVGRIYECVARGSPLRESFTVDAPLGRHPVHRKKQTVTPGGRAAVTHVSVIEYLEGCCRLLCRLETGRTHQIRAHLAHVGHPVIGDRLYNPRPGSAPCQLLHAARLTFAHPRSGEGMEFTSPLPERFGEYLGKHRGKSGIWQTKERVSQPAHNRVDL
ncbi:MAG: RluA family pseudouridine synthase [Oscillospiraceae bacterium]|jgi:23S rRNA pseudouridine1911/1915/1917 synthase|nr:RluA family pseudouridine synthase [Oscillospiraceae bacterium]